MRKSTFKKGQTFLYSIFVSLAAATGILSFAKVFPEWNPVLYFLTMAALSLSAGMLVWVFRKAKEKPRPGVWALIAFAAFFACACAAVFAVNNVILKEVNAPLAALIMSCVFALFFIAGAAVLAFSCVKKPGERAVALLAGAAMLLYAAYTASSPALPETYEHPYIEKTEVTEGNAMVPTDAKLIVNADDSHWWGFFNQLADANAFDEESMNAYVMQYADTGVTDIMFNVFCQSSDVPSEIMTFRGDLYGQTEQNGAPVDYSPYYGLSEIYNTQKKDIFAVWFASCREHGIRPWISLRMNDCHDPDGTTSLLRGSLFYTARENGWMIGEEYGYYRNCLNYAVPEVRQLMLDYTREQLMKYDVYGLELDFMREIYCFDYIHADAEEIAAIMNQYMRDTAAIVAGAAEKHGHEIKLTVRLPRDIDQAKVFGFDARAWQKEGLVDAITVTPRWSTCDSMMPVAEWKKELPGVEIWTGIETLVNRQAEGSTASPEVARGYAAQYLTDGADGVYLFNYMSAGTVNARNGEVYETCGPDTVFTLPRRHIVTWQDTAPAGWEPYKPLPLKVKKNKTAQLSVGTGYIPEGQTVSLLIGAKQPLEEGQLSVAVNARACGALSETELIGFSEASVAPVPGGYCEDGAYIYRCSLPDASGLPNLLTLTFTANGKSVTVCYVEVDVGTEG